MKEAKTKTLKKKSKEKVQNDLAKVNANIILYILIAKIFSQNKNNKSHLYTI